jgi:hypothetical protein
MWLKIIFLSQYLFIAILCAEMSRVNNALRAYLGWSLKPMAQNYQYLFIAIFCAKISSAVLSNTFATRHMWRMAKFIRTEEKCWTSLI